MASAETIKTRTDVEVQQVPPAAANGAQDAGDAQGHLAEPTDEPQVAATPATPAASAEEQTDVPKPAQQTEGEEATKHDQAISEVAEEASCPKGEEELEKARCSIV